MSDTLDRVITKPEYLPEDLWTFWRKSLAKEDVKAMLHEAHPHQGYYRDGARPVQFFFEPLDWTLYALVDGKDVDGFATYTDLGAGKFAYVGDTVTMRKLVERWTWISERPVSVADYDARVKTGHWPGENEVVTRSNNAPSDDSYEGIQAQIDELVHEAKRLMALGAAKTQVQANEASDVAERLGKLNTKADNLRKVEGQPHLDATREINSKWGVLTDAASIYKRLKDAVVEPFLKAQKRIKEEAERKAREEADRARREAAEKEAAARRAADEAVRQGNAAAAVAAKKAQDEADAARAQADVQEATALTVASTPVTAGSRGRRTSLRSVTVVTIEDRDAVLTFFKDRQEITELLQSLAEKMVKAGAVVPGVKVTKDQDAA